LLNWPTSSLFLGVYADHRISAVQVAFDLLIDVLELRIAVRVLAALNGLGVGLQAEPLPAQQISDGIGTDAMSLAGQLRSQGAGRLRRPPQRGHRIASLIRLDQGQQCRTQRRIQIGKTLAAPARPARPAQRLPASVQLGYPPRHRVLRDACRARYRPDPTMAQRPRLGSQQQPTLPLIQMREDHLELRRQQLLGIHRHGHTTSDTIPQRNRYLFLGNP
jgi:hypothetical protein